MNNANSEHEMINAEHIFFKLSNHVGEISKPLKVHLGIHYFAFKRTYNDGSKIYLFNHPEYYQYWFSKEYYLLGNREAKPSNYENGYDLWECLPDPYKLYDEGAELFNIANGLTITRRHDDYCDFFFFATSVENKQMRQLYFERREVFEKYCDYFLSSSDSLIRQAEKSKIILPLPQPIKLYKPAFEITDFLRDIKLPENDELWQLTERELECAYILAEGKSYKEIARVLGVSPRTIEEHSGNIRQKLGCKSKSELISLLTKIILK